MLLTLWMQVQGKPRTCQRPSRFWCGDSFIMGGHFEYWSWPVGERQVGTPHAGPNLLLPTLCLHCVLCWAMASCEKPSISSAQPHQWTVGNQILAAPVPTVSKYMAQNWLEFISMGNVQNPLTLSVVGKQICIGPLLTWKKYAMMKAPLISPMSLLPSNPRRQDPHPPMPCTIGISSLANLPQRP